MLNRFKMNNDKLKNVDLSVWLADLTYTQQGICSDVMPYALSCIATYAESKLVLSKPIRLFKYRLLTA